MSDRMHPIPFEDLLNWIIAEYRNQGSVFGCRSFWKAEKNRAGVPFFGRKLENPLGPAAGPHTQLAQNIVAGYVSGGRLFELKTVQILDGEDLHVNKPCILAEDEGYNCEWSTELTVPQAMEEYIKAWFLLHFLAAEYGFGAQDGFAFNMSVGYDLKGIQSPKIDTFIESMKDASGTAVWEECRTVLRRHLHEFAHFSASELDAVSPSISPSITVSTMHGCPAEDIEKIVVYLLEEKGLNLYLKCNPTLLGYDTVRTALDALGFDYIQFKHASFDHDLQYQDAIPMIRRIRDKAVKLGRGFGVKLTNTFPVDVLKGELPDETMYMSGRTLLPLSLRVTAAIGREFEGKLPVSYCGGIDASNVKEVAEAGLCPITICTDLLKPGGYGRLCKAVNALMTGADAAAESTSSNACDMPAYAPQPEALEALAARLCGKAKESRVIRRPGSYPAGAACANCRIVCGNCESVCPNRANVILMVDGKKQMLHIDGMCNECGNCASFCADKTAPYQHKLTLFCSPKELAESANNGFAPLDPGCARWQVRFGDKTEEYLVPGLGSGDAPQASCDLPKEITDVIDTVRTSYPWLIYN